MIDLDVIEPSVSPYSSSVVLVPKKDGSVRFCIDFRKVNKVTEFDAEPMPNMEEVIIKMSGHKFFTKMDLSKGYWQVSLSERSKPLTAFETPRGLFQFKTMLFGLANSGATFCRLMRIILSKLPNVDSFVNDMWIFTETWEDQMTSLRQVLDRLRSAKLTAKPSKCMIGTARGQGTGCQGSSPTYNKKTNEVISWIGRFLPPFNSKLFFDSLPFD